MADDAPPDSPWLTKAKAAEYLGVSVKTIGNYINRGILRAYRIPGARHVRIYVSDLDKLPQPIETLHDRWPTK